MASVFGTPSHGSGGAAGGERAGIRAGTLVPDLKIGRGDYCSKEDRDTQHRGTYGVEGRHSLSWKKKRVCRHVRVSAGGGGQERAG